MIGKYESGIYTGYRVFKDDREIEYKVAASFYLDDVGSWEDYPFDNFKTDVTRGDKIYIELPRALFVMIEDFDAFDKMMKQHNKMRVNPRMQ